MKSKSMLFSLLFVIGLTLGLAACGGEKLPTQQLAIQGLDIKFNLEMLSAKAGQPIELTYENKGSIDHAFRIDGVAKEMKIRPGEIHVFRFTIKQPGDYEFVCAIPGHEMAGMKGILRIVAN